MSKDTCYTGPLGYLRKRWIDKATARMEADPEFQKVKAQYATNTPGTTRWEVLKWELDSGYLDNRPWYWHVYWKQQDLRSWWYRSKFYVRRHILGIRRPKGVWHFTHADILICPDCDYDGHWCDEPQVDGHACIAQMLTPADVHANVKDGYLESATCDQCGVSCPA